MKAVLIPSKLSGEFKFTMYEISHFRGHAVNNGDDSGFDYRFLGIDNPNLYVSAPIPFWPTYDATSKTETNQELLVVRSFDYGGRASLKCKVVISSANDMEFEAYVENTKDAKFVHIPRDYDEDRAGDGLPDAWEDLFDSNWLDKTKIATKANIRDELQDLDEAYVGANGAPVQHDDKGDGLSAFEEYRGFIIEGKHYRLNEATDDAGVANRKGGPLYKDLFIIDKDKIFKNFPELMPQYGLVYHRLVKDKEFKNNNYINFLTDDDQCAVEYINKSLSGDTFGHAGTFNVDDVDIRIDLKKISDYSRKYHIIQPERVVVAHETGHKFDLFHNIACIDDRTTDDNVYLIGNINGVTIDFKDGNKTIIITTPEYLGFEAINKKEAYDNFLPAFLNDLLGIGKATKYFTYSSREPEALFDISSGHDYLNVIPDNIKSASLSRANGFTVETIYLKKAISDSYSYKKLGIRGLFYPSLDAGAHIMDAKNRGSNNTAPRLSKRNSSLVITRTNNDGRKVNP